MAPTLNRCTGVTSCPDAFSSVCPSRVKAGLEALKASTQASLPRAAGTCNEHCRLGVFQMEAADCILVPRALHFLSYSIWLAGSGPA